MAKAKRKGDGEERAVVNLHRELRYKCERTLEKGARSDGSQTWDIDLYARGDDLPPLIGECKCQEKIGDYIWDWMGDNDFLTLRKNRKPRLYVVPERVWEELISGLQGLHKRPEMVLGRILSGTGRSD